MTQSNSRRVFLQRAAATAAGTCLPGVASTAAKGVGTISGSDRPRLGVIGLRYQGSVIAREASAYGDIVALCDVDSNVLAKAREDFGGQANTFEDYRDLLDRQDVDAVLIGSPDHWHASMLIDACKAGKDAYCEKPLTLTVEEGRRIVSVVDETKRVVQVGTWQRSDSRFRLAAEMVQAGRLGEIRKITVVLGKNELGGPFTPCDPPKHLNWDLWQGQTPDVPYIKERSHYTFRWWYEYSGGQMTDWGAHHIDIAQWALGEQMSGPRQVEGEATFPETCNGYNVAKSFRARFVYPSGVVLEVLDEGRNGLLIEGSNGRIFVNRGSLEGEPVEELASHPLPSERFRLYGYDNSSRPPRSGKTQSIINHMGNFFDCVVSRRTPISDVESQHRSATVCHLGNISMRLGRALEWDAEAEKIVGDEEASGMLRRPQRSGFEVV